MIHCCEIWFRICYCDIAGLFLRLRWRGGPWFSSCSTSRCFSAIPKVCERYCPTIFTIPRCRDVMFSFICLCVSLISQTWSLQSDNIKHEYLSRNTKGSIYSISIGYTIHVVFLGVRWLLDVHFFMWMTWMFFVNSENRISYSLVMRKALFNVFNKNKESTLI